jgi:aspartate/methionine/tyrosine aminotransferase
MSESTKLNQILQTEFPIAERLLSSRGQNLYFPTTGILKQSAEAKSTKINATIGIALNDEGLPMSTPSLLKHIGNDPSVLKYAPSFGIPELREVWKQEIYQKNPSLKNAPITLPVVTGGLTHGLSIVADMFLNPGDEVIVPDAFWGNYKLIFEVLHEAPLRTFELFNEKVRFNTHGLDTMLKQEGTKKIVILNFPNNPTGYTPTTDELRNIIQTLKGAAEQEKEILVICDDAYFGLVFEEGIALESPFSALATAHKNILAVKIDGATKEEFAWGLRIAFITLAGKEITPQSAYALEQKLGGAIRGNCSNCCTLSQQALLKAIKSPSHIAEKLENYEILKKRFLLAKKILKKQQEKFAPYFEMVPSNSGYFFCLKVNETISTETLRMRLIQNFSIGTIATGQLLRIAFSATPEEQIPILLEHIYQCCTELRTL